MYFNAVPKWGLAHVPENNLCPEGRSWITEGKPAPSKIAKGILIVDSCFPCGATSESWQAYTNTKKTHYKPMTWYPAQVTHVGFKPHELNTPKAPL